MGLKRRPGYSQDWPEVSRRVIERAGNRCRRCGAPNKRLISVGVGPLEGRWAIDSKVYAEEGGELVDSHGLFFDIYSRFVVVQLQAAHLNHDVSDNRDENLACLCRRCHLKHDKELHRMNQRATLRRKFYERTGQLRLAFSEDA